jgi:tetratricopeptide (TPR) repeat protein
MFKEIKDWLINKEFHFHKKVTVVVLLVVTLLTLMKVVIPFINNYWQNSLIHFGLIVAVLLTIFFYWLHYRYVFPKKNASKLNIIIAIVTENAKQKVRISNDFANQIRDLLRKYNLDDSYELIILHNHLSESIVKKIHSFYQAKKTKDTEGIENFDQLKKRLNAKLIVYGDLVERNASNNTYIFNLDAVLFHKPTDSSRGKVLHKEFIALWKHEISFLGTEESTGFKINAENIFFNAAYMIGLATFVDNNYKQGIIIWEALEQHVKTKSELSEYKDKIFKLKASSYWLQSTLLFFQGEIEESRIYRDKYLSLIPNDYDKYLGEAITQVKIRNNPEVALELVDKASKIAPSDNGTWRYSKFYLLIKLSRCKEALAFLDEILRFNYPTEIDTLAQVISYNTTCINEDPKHLQTHFIIGVFRFKKLNQPILAYEELDAFINSKETPKEWDPLKERAEEYLSEINKLIEA